MKAPQTHSLDRRNFLKTTGALVAGTVAAAGLAGCASKTLPATATDQFWLPEAWNEEHDVVVVGFGAAGASAGIAGLKAALPVQGAAVLVAISAVLTLIAGLIPSRLAAKKDPVVALRTE